MKNKKQASITGPQMQDALQRSGYLLESRLESILIANDWIVEANSLYPDPITGKLRELDISAMWLQGVGAENEHGVTEDYVFAHVLIECVNNPQPMVFLTKDAWFPLLHIEALKVVSMPATVHDSEADDIGHALVHEIKGETFLHYAGKRIATQFCSFAEKKNSPGTWMALHPEEEYDSFRKVCDALDHSIRKQTDDLANARKIRLNVTPFYPILVVQGLMFDGRMNRNGISLRRTNHVQYRRSILHGGFSNVYQIDIVTESYFSKLLKMITREAVELFRRAAASLIVDEELSRIAVACGKEKWMKNR